MASRILILQGHPDPEPRHLCHGLAGAYARGAAAAGHETRTTPIATLEFPILRTQKAYVEGAPPPDIAAAQADIRWADHLLLVYPLWHGTMPALLKGFIEQVMRPGFARETPAGGGLGKPLLTGKSARIVVTMAMPGLAYRYWFMAHGLKNLERNILGFCGVKPIRDTVYGSVDGANEAKRATWLAEMETLGRAAR